MIRKVWIPIIILMLSLFYSSCSVTTAAKVNEQMKLANKYIQEGKYEEAILAFNKVIEIEPNNVLVRLGMSKAYVATKKFNEAEKVLKDALGIESNNIDVREQLVKIYILQNNIFEAEKTLQQISFIDSKRDVKQLEGEVNLAKEIATSKENYDAGLKLMNEQKYIEAIASFNKVISKDSERYSDSQNKIKECKNLYISEYLQKAINEAQNQKYQSAIDYLDLILKLDPNNAEALRLKNEYMQAIQKQKDEEKRRQEEEQRQKQQASQMLTEEQAMDIAISYAKKKYNKFSVMSESLHQRNGKNYYVFRIMENQATHVVTLTRYYIEQKGGAAYEWNVVTDGLIPLR